MKKRNKWMKMTAVVMCILSAAASMTACGAPEEPVVQKEESTTTEEKTAAKNEDAQEKETEQEEETAQAENAGSGTVRQETNQTQETRVVQDISRTYCNPLPLPNLELRNGQPAEGEWFAETPASEEDIDFGIEKAQEYLAMDTWTDAEGRAMVRVGNVPLPSEHNFRTAADPTALFVDDTCYLYATGDCGSNNLNCWTTKDFITWEYQDVGFGVTAPSVIQIGDKYYMAGNGTPVYEADSPLGPWNELGSFTLPDGTETGFSDVCFFLDDDGRLYLSYSIGCPIMGAELNPENPAELLTDPIVLFAYDNSRSWTHFGSSFQNNTCGYCEGSQIFKYDGTYYLQVSSNGTENASYCIGVLKSTEGPLSGYTDQENNPVTAKEDGFLPGPGHGCFVTNPKSNVLMLFYTSVLGNSRSCFNRRISMDVCKIDENGNITVPETSITPRMVPGDLSGESDSADAGLSCLSKWASYWSNNSENLTDAFYAIDGSMNTWWEPDNEKPILISGLCGIYDVSAIQVCWQELGCEFTRANAVQFTLEYKDLETGDWVMLVDKSTNSTSVTDEYLTFDPVRTCAVRLSVLGNTEHVGLGISEFRIFGENHTLATEKGM